MKIHTKYIGIGIICIVAGLFLYPMLPQTVLCVHMEYMAHSQFVKNKAMNADIDKDGQWLNEHPKSDEAWKRYSQDLTYQTKIWGDYWKFKNSADGACTDINIIHFYIVNHTFIWSLGVVVICMLFIRKWLKRP